MSKTYNFFKCSCGKKIKTTHTQIICPNCNKINQKNTLQNETYNFEFNNLIDIPPNKNGSLYKKNHLPLWKEWIYTIIFKKNEEEKENERRNRF